MDLVQHSMERLRPILGTKNWDCCVLWKLSEDGRFVELVDCCCGGTTHEAGDDQELVFSFSCKDAMFQHPKTKSCDLLSQLPSSIPFDSGVHAQTMISNQVRWLNFSNNFVSSVFDENVGTRVLIPVPIGLVELFAAKQVSEDQSVIDLVASQFNMSMDQHCININTNNNIDSTFLTDDQNNPNDHKFQPPVSHATMLENMNLSSSTTTIPPMNFLQQFNYTENVNDRNVFIDGTDTSCGVNGFEQEIDAIGRQVMSENMNGNVMGHTLEAKKRRGRVHKDAKIFNRSDSLSDYSDLNDEDDEPVKPRRRNGKGPSKNLLAERNRRKKLNNRLYALRSLVPNITKLDRASILGDAVEYVKELQRQVEHLQTELEDHSDDEGDTINRSIITQQDFRPGKRPKSALMMLPNGSHVEGIIDMSSKQNQELENPNDNKNQQMEPQVEVDQLQAGNEFLVKVFCEHKNGGFVKLMEAFTSLGLEVTNVNVTSFRCLVMNFFKVEKRDSEMVRDEQVRESLLELMRHQPRVWPDFTTTNGYENDPGGDHQDDHHVHQYVHHSDPHNRHQSQLQHHHLYHLHT